MSVARKRGRQRVGAVTTREFEHALEVFRYNVQSGAQFFYAYLAVHAVAGEHAAVYRLLNRTPLFWNTSLGALQTATFIALGRVFDWKTRHNLNALLELADQNRQIFSKQPLPTDADFRRLKACAKRWNAIYDRSYRALRNKVFAHTVITDDSAIHAMMSKTKVRELERLFCSLLSMEKALWYLLKNGHQPVLRRQSYSLRRMLARPRHYRDKNAQERVVIEAKRLLLKAAES
jgi:AbiU2